MSQSFKESVEKATSIKVLWMDLKLRTNLISSVMCWLLSSFNFYLITFYLKSFPGNIYVNSLCFAGADMLAYVSSGVLLSKITVSQGFTLSYALSVFGGVLYLLFYTSSNEFVIPVIVTFTRIGGSMSFNIGYISVARLFPTEFVATVFGIVNMIAHMLTVGAPMVAEFSNPIPFTVFVGNAVVALVACRWLVELSTI